ALFKDIKYRANNNTKQAFNDDEEASLKTYLLTAARHHYGLTKTEVRNLAYQFAVAIRGMKKTLQAKSRLASFNKPNLSNLFKNNKEVLSRGNASPEEIWNCDETGVTTVHVPSKPKGIKQIGQSGQDVTIITAINEIGNDGISKVFSPIKTYYNSACSEWMVMNPAKPLTIYEITELVTRAFLKAFSTFNIQKDFETTELYLLNENVFEEHEFLTVYVTDRPLNDATGTQLDEQQETDSNVTEATESIDSAVPSCSNTISQG
ncbi:hypothetical protein ILUMI_01762, partial [Ignelater luminosus]